MGLMSENYPLHYFSIFISLCLDTKNYQVRPNKNSRLEKHEKLLQQLSRKRNVGTVIIVVTFNSQLEKKKNLFFRQMTCELAKKIWQSFMVIFKTAELTKNKVELTFIYQNMNCCQLIQQSLLLLLVEIIPSCKSKEFENAATL